MMKFSDTSLAIFRNFSSINQSIVLKPGKVQRTVAEDRVILAEHVLDEDIPYECGIYDFPQFLANINNLDKPDVEFYPDRVMISDETVKIVYHPCSAALITTPGDKSLDLPSVDVEFSLTKDMIQKILKVSSINALSRFSVVGEEGFVKIRVHDNSDTSNSGEMVVLSNYGGKDFESKFNIEHIRMYPDDYNVRLAFGQFAVFENTRKTLRYYIATQTR
jgi:hypothetical protein